MCKRKEFKNESKNVYVYADDLNLSPDIVFGKNVNIQVRNKLTIGKYARFGDNVKIRAENVVIGDHFYHHTPGLDIGGGGSNFYHANLVIGDRCVVHDNYINLARPVKIGNDVGLSPGVKIITHGFWGSVLEGHPSKFDWVQIGNNVIVGQDSMILPGVTIGNNVVIGANSTVAKDLARPNAIYAGNPAKLIREIEPLDEDERYRWANKFIGEFRDLCYHYGKSMPRHDLRYPWLSVNDFNINLETFEYYGKEDEVTDSFRDYIRRYGIRIYTERPFKNHLC